MRLTDSNFREHIWTYILQCSLATMTILVVLMLLDATLQTAIIASIGASAFIVFTAPNAFSAKTRALLGGYIVGTSTGIGCSLLSSLITVDEGSDWSTTLVIMGAVAVGISIFIMVITDSEHPPAAGLALAFVLNSWNFKTVLVVLLAPVLLSLIKYILRNHIRDLV